MKNTLLQEHELRLKMLNDIYGYIEKYNLELTYKDASISYKEDIQNLMDFAVRAETSSIYYLKKKKIKNALGVTDWNKAVDEDLNKRKLIHDAIIFGAEFKPNLDELINKAIERVIHG